MSTRGFYGVVSDDHYYAIYQHSDMYPDGHPNFLAEEAAEIAKAGDWPSVIDGWLSTAWLEYADSYLPQKLRDTVTHPDGGTYLRDDWAYAMRPRFGPGHPDSMGLAESPVYPFGPPHGRPSWKAAALQPAILKMHLPPSDGRFGVVVDVDNQEFVMLALWRERHQRSVSSVVIAVADLHDPDDLNGLIDHAAKVVAAWHGRGRDFYSCGPQGVTAARDWSIKGLSALTDGQVRRPAGFPPFWDTAAAAA